jgi:hypothetical protein
MFQIPTIFHTSSMHEVTVWQKCLNRNFAEKYHIQPSQATSLCCAYHATSGQPPRPNANPGPPPKPRPSPFIYLCCPNKQRPVARLCQDRTSQPFEAPKKCDASHSSPFIFPSCSLFSPPQQQYLDQHFSPNFVDGNCCNCRKSKNMGQGTHIQELPCLGSDRLRNWNIFPP